MTDVKTHTEAIAQAVDWLRRPLNPDDIADARWETDRHQRERLASDMEKALAPTRSEDRSMTVDDHLKAAMAIGCARAVALFREQLSHSIMIGPREDRTGYDISIGKLRFGRWATREDACRAGATLRDAIATYTQR